MASAKLGGCLLPPSSVDLVRGASGAWKSPSDLRFGTGGNSPVPTGLVVLAPRRHEGRGKCTEFLRASGESVSPLS